jgi:hypothetical protein
MNPVDSGDLIGLIAPGSPAAPSDETSRANELLTLFNSGATTPTTIGGFTYTLGSALSFGGNVNSAPLPTPATLDTSLGSGGQINENTTSFSLSLGGSTFDYLLVKWDNVDALYDVQGLTGTLDVTNNVVFNSGVGGAAQAASHADLFNASSVPDGGSTAAMLGAALIGIGLLRRKFSKNIVALS